MSDDDSAPEKEKGSYSLLGRFLLFLFIAGPASVFAFGIYGRIGLKNSVTAAMEAGNYMPMIILVLWIVGIISTAVMIFKR